MSDDKLSNNSDSETKPHESKTSLKKIAIVGCPNVGKSVVFNNLTKSYVTVSNYPGTTVEVSRGRIKIEGTEFEVIDTPGMYSLSPITEEERVARRILLKENPEVIIHVVDAKNLGRMLSFTLQLIEAGLPTILVLNMMDEAERERVEIDIELLEKELGVPVVEAVAITGKGMDTLKKRAKEYTESERTTVRVPVQYSFNTALMKVENLLKEQYGISTRTIGLLLLKEDEEIKELVKEKESAVLAEAESIIHGATFQRVNFIEYDIALEVHDEVTRIIDMTVRQQSTHLSLRERISRLMMSPITGVPILILVLYFGLYKFVGSFGAGTVVDFLEGTVFAKYINPFLISIFTKIIPWEVLRDLFVGEYGLLTSGFRYAVALILPLVTFFFLVFSVIEDTGYLPRLAMLIDRTFKKIGLSGRAVIPMVLGFGCATMATMVTRTLPTKRERVISTMLLALAVPCSAQLGVILALLEGHTISMLIWAFVIGLVFLFIGYLTAKILPGERPSFYMEVPPLRLPKAVNILSKTYVRVKWYFKEVLPLFLLASFCIWLGQLTRLFDLCIYLLQKPVALIGLPPEASKIFLFGFFRRDYGAAGLYACNKQGLLSGVQLVVACIALTLFLPCIAQFIMNVKERGWKTGLGISVFILFFSFGVAYIVNIVLMSLGWVL